MKKRLNFIFLIIVSLFLILFFRVNYIKSQIRSSPQEVRTQFIEKHTDYLWFFLDTGMSKEDVVEITGEPQNDDNENVWIWIDKYKEYSNIYKHYKWNEMYNYCDGFFLIFIDNRLAYTISANSAGSPTNILVDKGLAE